VFSSTNHHEGTTARSVFSLEFLCAFAVYEIHFAAHIARYEEFYLFYISLDPSLKRGLSVGGPTA